MKLRKCLFAILKLWKHENICLQYMKYENMNIFAYITWIENFVGITLIMKKIKMFVRNTELWKYLFAMHELWKQENICITRIMKTLKCLFAVH